MHWYDPTWTKARRVRIPASKISGSGVITDYRHFIWTTDAKVQAAAQADGDDILFTSEDGVTKLDHELVFYDNATGEMVVWVRIPTVIGGIDNFIWMYYGNGACAAQENPTGVWSGVISGVAVYHFQDDFSDSTGNGNTGTNDGTSAGTGKTKGCRVFDGSNDSIGVSGTGFTTIEQASVCAVCALVKPGTGSTRQQIFYKGNTASETLSLYLNAAGKAVFSYYHASGYEYEAVGTTSLTSADWHRIWGIRDGSTFKIFVDGVDDTATSSGGSSTQETVEDVLIGKRLNEDYFLDGSLDEVWVMDGAPSDDYIATEWNNLDDVATFGIFGPERDVVTAVTADREIPLDEFAALETDRVLPFWVFANVKKDVEVLIDALTGIKHDDDIPLDAMKGIAADLDMPIDGLENIIVSQDVLVDAFQNVESDSDFPITPWGSVAAERDIAISVFSGKKVDREFGLTILRSIHADRAVSIAVVKGMQIDDTIHMAVLRMVNKDTEIMVHALRGQIADSELYAEAMEKIVADREFPANWLKKVEADRDLPMWARGKITADYTMDIDTLKRIYADRNIGGEAKGGVQSVSADETFPMDVIAGMKKDEDVIIDGKRWIISTYEIAGEAMQGMIAEQEIIQDVLRGLEIERDIASEGLEGVKADRDIDLSILQGQAMTSVHADREMGLSVLAEVIGDKMVVLDVQGAVSARREILMSVLKSVASDHEIAVCGAYGGPVILTKKIRTRLVDSEISAILYNRQI